MPVEKAMDNVYYVGVLDKELRVFDIIMETQYGTTYNSYIVKGKDKTVLIETVKDKFHDEFVENVEKVCSFEDIDYIVVNHTEPDHTGSLKKVLDRAVNATVLASPTAITFLNEIVNEPFKHMAVTDKDEIDIGGMTLKFMNLPMLHWPDSMFTYIPEIKALFTCDTFGCHFADDSIFNDKMPDIDFMPAYRYYFDNILGPFKTPFLERALDKIKDLPIEFVGTGHGPVLRENIRHYINFYYDWCTDCCVVKGKVTVAYVSAYGYTKSLAEAVVKGLKEGGISDVEVFDLVYDDMQKAKDAIEISDGFLLGSPTLVGDVLPPVLEVINCLNPIIHKGKFAGAFGSYGWSGEAVPNIMARLAQLRFNLPLEGMKVRFKPTDADIENAVNYGKDFAKAVLGV